MTINPLVHDKYNITGGAAKSMQSINVAAVFAAAAAGLASSAATHRMKKLHVWHKTGLFLFLLQFFWRTSFLPMCMSALNSFCGKGGPLKENVFNIFLLGIFW